MNVRLLSPELQQKAEKELNEVPSRIPQDLEQIKEWLAKQPHLNARTDDQWLLSFLRSCKFSLYKTKLKLDMFYTMRTLLPEYFSKRDPFLPEIQECVKRGTIIRLPQTKGPAGPLIGLIRYKYADGVVITPTVVAKTLLMLGDIVLMEYDNYNVAGQDIVIDLKDVSHRFVLQITPAQLRKWVILIQNAYPTRIKSIHFVNAPSYFATVFKIFKSLLSEKLQKRIHNHSGDNIENLYKSIPLSLLPNEYGGEAGSINELAMEVARKLESYKDWFLDDAIYCSIEAKRPGKPRTSADLFGVEGSFRKLEVD